MLSSVVVRARQCLPSIGAALTEVETRSAEDGVSLGLASDDVGRGNGSNRGSGAEVFEWEGTAGSGRLDGPGCSCAQAAFTGRSGDTAVKQDRVRSASAPPTLSVVVTARNDDHGGSLLRRIQIFVDGWVEQARRHQLDSELIIVEWNPPADRSPLAEALAWPRDTGACQIRIITVPASIHARFRHADKLPLFQMIAKNVGVRRAQGQFVLCTNVDLLFSDDLVHFLASGRLRPGALYRIDRRDVPASVPTGVPVAQQLSYCARHVVRINTRWGTFRTNRWGALPLPAPLWMVWVWGSRALRVPPRHSGSGAPVTARGCIPGRSRDREGPERGRIGGQLTRLSNSTPPHLEKGPPHVLDPMPGPGEAIGLTTGRIAQPVSRLSGLEASLARLRLKRVHANGSGDFTLLSRDWWHRLRGYPEVEVFSLHLDSLMCQIALISGAKEVVLGGRKRIYHIEHGAGWSPEEADRLAARIQSLGVPVIDFASYKWWIDRMQRDPFARIVNSEDWGLAEEELPEIDPTGQLRKSSRANG